MTQHPAFVQARVPQEHYDQLKRIADSCYEGSMAEALHGVLRSHFDDGLHLAGVGLSDKCQYRAR